MTEGMPAQFEHCLRVYAAMLEEAKDQEYGEITEAALAQGKTLPTRKVWEGHTTRIFAKLELSTPYYTSVMNHLKRMGCVLQIRRGGGSQTSAWELRHEPTLDLYENRGGGSVNATSLNARTAANEKAIRDLHRKMDIIMNHLGVRL